MLSSKDCENKPIPSFLLVLIIEASSTTNNVFLCLFTFSLNSKFPEKLFFVKKISL